jgi:Fe2+ or Zn2+ uptake regulation protein
MEPKRTLMTEQRRVILEELQKTKSHPTADEVYRMVRRRLPRVSLGTVYRNLERLATEGVIQKMEIAGTQKRFDGFVADHYHMRCVGCGRVEDAPVKDIAGLEDALGELGDYEVIGHRLEFMVLCPSCKNAET